MEYPDFGAYSLESLRGALRAKGYGHEAYLSILALVLFLTNEEGLESTGPLRKELAIASRGGLKRAIKCMRAFQPYYRWPTSIDGAVSLIRNEFLRK